MKDAKGGKTCVYGATFPLKLTTNSESESGSWKAEKQDRTFESHIYGGKENEVHEPLRGHSFDRAMPKALLGSPKGYSNK